MYDRTYFNKKSEGQPNPSPQNNSRGTLSCINYRMAYRLALPTLGHRFLGLTLAGGGILYRPKWHFIALSPPSSYHVENFAVKDRKY